MTTGLFPPSRFWSRVCIKTQEECWNWSRAKSGSYGSVRWRIDGKTGAFAAHVVALFLTSGERARSSEGKVVRHLCGNPSCCNPAHLKVGTHAENWHDAKMHGTEMRAKNQVRGERQHLSKLTSASVLEIRKRYLAGETQSRLASEYGVTQAAIGYIVRRDTWKHI